MVLIFAGFTDAVATVLLRFFLENPFLQTFFMEVSRTNTGFNHVSGICLILEANPTAKVLLFLANAEVVNLSKNRISYRFCYGN